MPVMHICAFAPRVHTAGGPAQSKLTGYKLPLEVNCPSCTGLIQPVIVSSTYRHKQALLSLVPKDEVKSLGINYPKMTRQSSGAIVLLHQSD